MPTTTPASTSARRSARRYPSRTTDRNAAAGRLHSLIGPSSAWYRVRPMFPARRTLPGCAAAVAPGRRNSATISRDYTGEQCATRGHAFRVNLERRSDMNPTKSPNLLLALATVPFAGLALAVPAARAETNAAQAAQAAQADMVKTVGFVPSFAKAFPAEGLPGIWQEVKDFELNKKTALDGKTKDLIGLAIAAQMPSRLTAWSYSKCAKANGATETELQEAGMASGRWGHWSRLGS